MADPIGISFMPSQDNQAMGPQNNMLDGAGGDLSQAIKILSLRLPRAPGAQSIAPDSLLNGQGSSGVGGGFNPHAAVFEALLRAILGGGGMPPGGRTTDASTNGNVYRPGIPGGSLGNGNRTSDPTVPDDGLTRPTPRITPGAPGSDRPIDDAGGGLLAPTFRDTFTRDPGGPRFKQGGGY